MSSPPNAFLLLLLTAIAGLAGLFFMIWLFQVWRRGLQRGKPKSPGGPGVDAWQTAGQRLKLDDASDDKQN
jgi:hypothetical protein